jgi:uncharacterized membrane protein
MMSMRIESRAHAFFGVTMAGLGVLGFVQGAFTPTWAGVPRSFPAREALVYLSAGVSLLTGLGLLWRRTALLAARVLLATFVVWFVAFRVPVALHYPTNSGAWWAVGDTAALILYVWFAGDWDRTRLRFATGNGGLRIARVLYGLGLIPIGLAHFTFLDRTVSLVPAWLPWHTAWAYFTGAAFIAAGLGVLTGVYARLAATLSAVEMGLFILLVWVPIDVMGQPTAMDWTETVGSWVLMAAAWMVADSYRGTPLVKTYLG